MKKIKCLVFSTFLFANYIYSQNETSLCRLLAYTYDYSSDTRPSIGKLKKMIGKNSNDEVLEYAIYLHESLIPKDVKYYEDIQRAATGELYYNQKIIEENQLKIANSYILPIAKNKNIKAITFLSGKNYMKSHQVYNEIVTDTANNPAYKYILYQLNYNLGKISIQDMDRLLSSYFAFFKRNDLLRIRKTIDQKITQIENINKEFQYYSNEYDKYSEYRSKVLSKLPTNIEDPRFCLSFHVASIKGTGMLSIVPVSFDGNIIPIDALSYLISIRRVLDLTMKNYNPQSLAQILYDYRWGRIKSVELPNYKATENQYFATDKEWGPIIYKLLSGIIICDENRDNISTKSYYLNKAAQLGSKDAYFNLACLFHTLYCQTNKTSFNDSCLYYLEKSINVSNYNSAYTLKGLKTFNGDGYLQNRVEGIQLIQKAQSLGCTTAKKLLEELPSKLLEGSMEGFYFQNYIRIRYPWNFKVNCSNNCGKETYPKNIVFGKEYDGTLGMPQIVKSVFFLDNLGNPTLNISDNDFRTTFSIAELGFKFYKHVMCSKTCQLEHTQKNDKNWNSIKANRIQFDKSVIKCLACSNTKKREDMISVSGCPCIDKTSSSVYLDLIQAGDLFSDTAPKVCSSICQINYCKTKCASKGYTTSY